MARILSISQYSHLLTLRNHALALAGYAVVAPTQPSGAVRLAALRVFDAVIIGHSVERAAREEIILLHRLQSYMPIIFVYAAPETSGEPLADLSLD